MKHRILNRIIICLAFVVVAISSSEGAAIVNPRLSLVRAVSLATFNATIDQGTATISLDLRVSTGGLAVSGLQFYLTTTPGNRLTLAAAALVALDSPFTTGDVFSAPAAGATVNQSGATTVFFKAGAGDYAPFADSAIARYTFDTSRLAAGIYVFTPNGQELTNANTTVTAFDPPGSFTLTVNPVPEPTAMALLGLGGTLLNARRRRTLA